MSSLSAFFWGENELQLFFDVQRKSQPSPPNSRSKMASFGCPTSGIFEKSVKKSITDRFCFCFENQVQAKNKNAKLLDFLKLKGSKNEDSSFFKQRQLIQRQVPYFLSVTKPSYAKSKTPGFLSLSYAKNPITERFVPWKTQIQFLKTKNKLKTVS